jgi:hypothetical protein
MMILFSSDNGECLPMNHFISRVLWSKCLRLVSIWSFQVRRLSKCIPRNLTVSTWGMTAWFKFTGGHCPRLRANDMWDDLDSLIFSFHFRVQVLISSRCSWRFAEVCVGSGSVVKMAVSSAKVLRIVLSDWGRSAVFKVKKWRKKCRTADYSRTQTVT